MMQGQVADGTGQAAPLIKAIPAQQWRHVLGYDPYPGTLNVKVGLANRNKVVDWPGRVFETGRSWSVYYPCWLNDIPCHASLSMDLHSVEILAPERLRDLFVNGDTVTIEPRIDVTYWDTRWSSNQPMTGSEGDIALWKASQVAKWATMLNCQSIVDVGCGDGRQAKLFPKERYRGLDPSQVAISKAQEQCPDMKFEVLTGETYIDEDLAVSMDVLLHLTGEERLEHLNLLFRAKRGVLIWSSNFRGVSTARHVHRQEVSHTVSARFPAWNLVHELKKPWAPLSLSSLLVYRRVEV